MIGLCHHCFSSGVDVEIETKTGEPFCKECLKK